MESCNFEIAEHGHRKQVTVEISIEESFTCIAPVYKVKHRSATDNLSKIHNLRWIFKVLGGRREGGGEDAAKREKGEGGRPNKAF